ncbi:MAG TPA: molybdopterin cofactor-binding domain-containing protein [Roseiflexaceae bacterium]|nr:molybdopterin cofactor-binding domain-containing protein [Roseiflexaceae bacterium]
MADLSRRVFLKASLGAGASFVLGAYLSGCESAPAAEPAPAPATSGPAANAPISTAPTLAPAAPAAATALPAEPAPVPTTAHVATATPAPATASFAPDVFLRIDNNNTVTVIVSRSEMGQGVRTSFPMIVAEELDADWSTVRVEQAATDDRYGRLNTFGSRSIVSMWDTLRQTGAAARAMLIAAAAQTWGLDQQELATEGGAVIHPPSNRRLTYGELAETAAQQPVPDQVALKDPGAFRLLGTPRGQHDAPNMIDGSAIYGIDVRLPGMRYAVVARSPVFGGRLANYDATPAMAVAGVRQVVAIDNAVAVVADTTWAAMRGRAALQINWDPGQNAQLSDAGVRGALRQSLPAASRQAGRLEAIYEIPYYAHATMEPMNCVADVRPDRCDVWAPTQAPQNARDVAARITGLPSAAVAVHVTLMGMGLGRRSATDFIAEAVQVSKAIGEPVQVLWTREDDMQHDLYHPTSAHYLSAHIDPAAEIEIQTAGGSRRGGAIPVGAWRSVSNFPQAFIRESFVDELAAALGQDPYELRRQRLPLEAHRAVLDLAAHNAGWGGPLPAGSGRGIAFYVYGGGGENPRDGRGTYVAQVVEASVAGDGSVRVQRVVCAVDCGVPINPEMIKAQIEGGIVHAITATLKGAITIEGGAVQQTNFHEYPLLRINEMPLVEVSIVPSTRTPQGMGEMGVPTLAPALANAIFSATGKRIRRLPIRPQDLM